MNPATIIHKAQADGVKLALSPSGNIEAIGDKVALNRWRDVIRDHKVGIIDVLKVGADDTATAWRWLIHYADREPLEVSFSPAATHADMMERYPGAVAAEPFAPTTRQPSTLMIANEEAAIRAWLARIEEADPATICGVIAQCQSDGDARDYFIELARR